MMLVAGQGSTAKTTGGALVHSGWTCLEMVIVAKGWSE